MNELILLNGPQLKFIIPEHKESFIKNLFEIYSIEVDVLAITSKWFPEISNITSGIDERFIVGGTVTRRSNDPHFYTKDEANIPPTHVNPWAKLMLGELNKQLKDMDIDYALLKKDIEEVLKYYHVSYVEEKMVAVNKEWVSVGMMYNCPIVQVW